MPIRYAKNIVVDQATAALMSQAFQAALQKVQDSGTSYAEDHAEWLRETLALRIIATVQEQGERDVIRVTEDALLHLAQATPPGLGAAGKEPSS